ncbi:uncharacterized protein [Solanum tuberosum]|uniref:uncharacterized protein n=1 Tax=Solanum tuberosum TaxID=4113 RepID=UPI0003D27F83|nr:PREDICTED: uncharacterized protein LOC102595351 [Solanum tuberosum]
MASTTKGHEQVPPGEPMSMGQHMLDKGAQMMQSLKPIKQMNQHVCRSGVEYILSDRIFESLPQEEQKLWHSHAHEIKSGLWVNPRVPEMVIRPELENLTKTYGKFWCTWQTDRGDKLPIGPPSLMMSPQPVDLGIVKIGLVKKRDDKYNISTDAMKTARADLSERTRLNPRADYWVEHGKGFMIDVEDVEMKKIAPFP